MTAPVHDSGLYLPSSVIDEMAVERARRMLGRADPPVTFHGNRMSLQGLGRQPSHEALLEELKGWPSIAASRIADRFQSLDAKIVQSIRTSEGTLEDEEIDDHPAAIILGRPNPIFSKRLMLRLLAFHIVQTGEAYWQKIRDPFGMVVELWPMPPQSIEPIPDPERVIGGYLVTSGQGEQTKLDRDDVIRFWWPDPETLYTSRGVLGPQSVEHDALRFLSEHLRSHFQNDATPRVALKAGADAESFEPDTKDAFLAEWKQRYAARGGRNSGLPAFLPTGWDAHEFASDGQEQFVPLDERWATQIMAAYGVPGSIAGIVVDVNRAAAETNQFVFDRNTILPIANLVSDVLTENYASEFGDGLSVRFQPFVAPDKDFDLQRERQDLETKVRTAQQVLRDRGGDPEDAPWAELPIGTLADQPYTGEVVADPLEESADDLEAPRERGSGRPGVTRSDFSPAAAWERLLQVEEAFTAQFQRAMLRVFEVQRREVVKRLRTRERATSVEDVFALSEWDRLFLRVIEPLRRKIFRLSGEEVGRLLGAGFRLTDAAVEVLQQLGAEMRGQVNEVTRARVARELSQGTAAGESIGQLAKRINVVFRDRKRSTTIARTEVLTAHSSAQMESFRQAGDLVRGKQWNTSRDGSVRDSHTIDGQVRDLQQPFALRSGSPAMFPGDPALPAGDRINCRCFPTPVLEGEDDED